MHSLKKTRVLELTFCKVLLESADGQCCILGRGEGIDGVFWHGTPTHTHTHTHTRQSTALLARLMVDHVPKMKPGTLIQQSPVKPLPSCRLCFTCQPPPRASVIGMDESSGCWWWRWWWSWWCFVLLSRGKSICCFHSQQERSDVIQVPFP